MEIFQQVIESIYNFISTPAMADLVILVLLLIGFVSGFATRTYYQVVHFITFLIVTFVLAAVLRPVIINFINADLLKSLGAKVELEGGTTIDSFEKMFEYVIEKKLSGPTDEYAHLLAHSAADAFAFGLIVLAVFVIVPLFSGIFYLLVRIVIPLRAFRHNRRWLGGLIGMLHMLVYIAIAMVGFGSVCPAFTALGASADALKAANDLGIHKTLIQFISIFDPGHSYVFGWLSFGGCVFSYKFDGVTKTTLASLMELVAQIVPPAPAA